MSFEYAGVYLLDNPFFLDNNYDYYIPSELRADIRRGSFVTVPFGNANRRSIAVVTELREKPLVSGIDCKPVFSLCGDNISLSEELLGLAFFVKEQTLCTLGEAIRAMVPASVISRLTEVYSASPDFDDNIKGLDPSTLLVYEYIRKKGSVRFDLLKNKFGPASETYLRRLREAGAVLRNFEVKDTAEKNEIYYVLSIPRGEAEAICDGSDKKYRLRSPMHAEIVI